VALKTPSSWKLKAYKNNTNTHKKIVSHPGGHQDEPPPPPERLHLVEKTSRLDRLEVSPLKSSALKHIRPNTVSSTLQKLVAKPC